ncbi:Gldg family protein [Planctomicrobium piriforme]|uniref:ABC-2 type transport system permease protein n=1 Tax=Planctomicrobium piriforme TaxID=1576369 RepID=A0A1I3QU51_9PLAN|nr:Gldg family protein [Planctomicrobium piriforme]SFJ37475.1 ABC-2 type transport system permease protein [Planctomicrobium piriforme]
MRQHVVLAVFKRNVTSYFSGMLGYLFIVVFVVAGAFLAFNDQFFANNLANLDQLSARFPLLLLFIIPAITMTAWADERKLGTDELLFTLPATDFEILMGKYLAVLAVYTVALAFSLTHAMVLAWLGNPDWGLIATTYLGYWLAGGALLAAGMFASVLTSSATVAFVLGAVICAIPVFIDEVPGIQTFLKDRIGINEPLSVAGHLRGFTSGKVTYSGIFYFVGLAAFFLYLNAVMIARRHWAGGKDAASMSGQYLLRVACLSVALLALTYTFATAGYSVDSTSESLHTLSPTTLEIIKKIPDDKPVTIQAFISPDVPQDYVAIRKDLINKIVEYDKRGGKKLQARIVDVDPYSHAAEQALALGIEPRTLQSEEGGRLSQNDVYMGVVLTSGFDTVTIPFFDRGTPIEYELTRSVGTISNEKRRVVGILSTDVKPNGGFDMQSFRQLPQWQIVTELKKQYDVKDVSPDSPITTEMDVLIAILPSSLTQPQMQNLVEYVESGKPVLIFDDPAPVWGPNNQASGIVWAPLEPKPAPGGGMGMMGMQNRGEPKADGGQATSLLKALGIRWDVRKSVFDVYNPHPRFADSYPPELMFIDGKEGVNNASPITSGLQELISFAPGFVAERDKDVDIEWLLKSRKDSTGTNTWDQIAKPGFLGGKQYNFDVPHKVTDDSYVLAARIKGKDGKKTNAIFVADVDLVHDIMFQVWQQQLLDFKIDNVLFVLNSVDSLAGDERYIDLRKRRAQYRTLTELENRKKKFEVLRSQEIAKADEAANKELDEAKVRLQKILDDLRKDLEKGNVDVGTVQVRLQNATEAENRKLGQREKEIEREKNETVRRVKTETEQDIRRIERGIWRWAVFIPPLPAIILGLIILISRVADERKGISSDRLRE